MNPALAAAIAKLRAFKAGGRPVPSAAVALGNSPVSADAGGAARAVAQLSAQAIANLAALPPNTVANYIYLTKNADDPYHGSLENAIAACTNPSASNPWVINIMSPGLYTTNAVVPDYVSIASLVTGFGGVVTLTSSSGVTLTVPALNSVISNIAIQSTSANSADTALKVVAGISNPGSLPLQIAGCMVSNPGAAYPIRTAPGSEAGGSPVIILNSLLQSFGAAKVAELQGAGLVLFNGGINQFAPPGNTGLEAGPTAFCLLFVIAVNGDGPLLDANGGTIVVFDGKSAFAGNAMRARNGGVVVGADWVIGSPVSSLLDVDATSVGFLGEIQVNGGGSPYNYITVAPGGFVGFLENLNYAEGTTAAPNQRPATPKPGMTFLGTDLVPPVVLTYTSLGWLKPDGTVVP